MKEIVLLGGVRTPFLKSGTLARDISAQELGRQVLVALFNKYPVKPGEVDEVIFGCVAQPVEAANIARVVSINAGIPLSVPSFTVQRNCASSMQSVSSAIDMILAGRAEMVVAGGTESLSNSPLIYNREFTRFFGRMSHARTRFQKLKVLASFRPSMLKPRIGLLEGLTDPTCGMIMGRTAEVLARDLGITRHQQDAYALSSHHKALAARKSGRFAMEISPLYIPPKFNPVTDDNGIHEDEPEEMLARLHPAFDRAHGTVTAGNSSQITDGAVALLITTMDRARAMGLKPLARIVGHAFAGLEPQRMGLGPVAAMAKLLPKLGLNLSDMKLVEINEAFAAQVLACLQVAGSDRLMADRFGISKALGDINPEILNVNGGAIALGHPVGSSGGRLLLTLAVEMGVRKLQRGLASLCVGGGQGAAFVLERTEQTQ